MDSAGSTVSFLPKAEKSTNVPPPPRPPISGPIPSMPAPGTRSGHRNPSTPVAKDPLHGKNQGILVVLAHEGIKHFDTPNPIE